MSAISFIVSVMNFSECVRCLCVCRFFVWEVHVGVVKCSLRW